MTDTFALNKPAQGLFEKLVLQKLEKLKSTIIHLIEVRHFMPIIKHLRIEVIIMTKIAFTGGGTVGHVSVNLSLIPTALNHGYSAFYIGSKAGIEKEMIESQLPDIEYHAISSGKLRRYISVENAKDILKW